MYITKHTINLCKTSDDGRMTRMKLKEFYYKKIPNRIYIPKERMWYTCSLFSVWIPVNIKSTTILTCDNTGNLTFCVYAYTDEKHDLHI